MRFSYPAPPPSRPDKLPQSPLFVMFSVPSSSPLDYIISVSTRRFPPKCIREGRSPVREGQLRRIERADTEELHYQLLPERFTGCESLSDHISAGVVEDDVAVLDVATVHAQHEAPVDEIFP